MSTIETRLARLYSSMKVAINPDLSTLNVKVVPNGLTMRPGEGYSQADLENMAHALIANIATLCDHSKIYCRDNNINFDPQKFINANRDVAIVHDLWNTDKHVELDRPPRSGFRPKITDLRRVLSLTGGATGVQVSISSDGNVQLSEGAGATASIFGVVVDENGGMLGILPQICESAIAAWEAEFKRVGIIT